MSRHGKIDWKRYGECLCYTIITMLLVAVLLALLIFPFVMLYITDSLWWMLIYLAYFIFFFAGWLYQEGVLNE